MSPVSVAQVIVGLFQYSYVNLLFFSTLPLALLILTIIRFKFLKTWKLLLCVQLPWDFTKIHCELNNSSQNYDNHVWTCVISSEGWCFLDTFYCYILFNFSEQWGPRLCVIYCCIFCDGYSRKIYKLHTIISNTDLICVKILIAILLLLYCCNRLQAV